MDGFQREMADVEHHTLLAWLQRVIFIPTPPLFVTKTHVGSDRDEFISYHRKRPCPRLYARLPVDFTLPAAKAKLYICRALLAASYSDQDTSRIKGFFTAAYRVECSARSPGVEFVFIYPEL